MGENEGIKMETGKKRPSLRLSGLLFALLLAVELAFVLDMLTTGLWKISPPWDWRWCLALLFWPG